MITLNWKWHSHHQLVWIYWINQKHEFYPKMQWTFGIQANLDTINQLSCHINRCSNLWTQELPGNHTQCNKTNIEIQILYLECQWKPYKSIIFLWCLICTNIIDFDIERIWTPKGCAHVASTESTECPEPRNQGDTIDLPIREIWGWLAWIHLHMFIKSHLLLKWTTQKTIFWHSSFIGIYMKYYRVESNSIKRWFRYWVMSFKHWKHLSAYEDQIHIRLL